MRSGDIKSTVSQMALDHNIKAASALRRLAVKIGSQLAETGVQPVISPTQSKGKHGHSISMKHGAKAVVETTSARRMAEAHRAIHQQLGSKASVTKMMGL